MHRDEHPVLVHAEDYLGGGGESESIFIRYVQFRNTNFAHISSCQIVKLQILTRKNMTLHEKLLSFKFLFISRIINDALLELPPSSASPTITVSASPLYTTTRVHHTS